MNKQKKDRLVRAAIMICMVAILWLFTFWLFSSGESAFDNALAELESATAERTAAIDELGIAIDELEFAVDAYADDWLTDDYIMAPWSDDNVLHIDWPHSIFITDRFTTTIIMRGPVTVTFRGEE